MQWEVLIIPLIAFGAWILATLFKEDEAAKKGTTPRRFDGEMRPERRPELVVDRPREQPKRRRDMPTDMESRGDATRSTQAAGNALRRQPPKPARPEAAVPAEVIEEVVRPTTPLPVAKPRVGRKKSPVIAEVIRLLRSPQSAAVGMVMREIIDRPRSLRRR